MNHENCTCCRHWRVVETESYLAALERLGKEEKAGVVHIIQLLPPRTPVNLAVRGDR